MRQALWRSGQKIIGPKIKEMEMREERNRKKWQKWQGKGNQDPTVRPELKSGCLRVDPIRISGRSGALSISLM